MYTPTLAALGLQSTDHLCVLLCRHDPKRQWKYIQYPPQSVSREEYYKKMREVAEEDK